MPKKISILICDRFSSEAAAWLKGSGRFEISNTKGRLLTDFLEKESSNVRLTEGLILRSRTKVTDKVLELFPSLKVIVSCTSGFDHIDFEACKKRQITVMHTPDANIQSAAEMTFSLMLASLRKITKAFKAINSQDWSREALVGTELHGKTIGIIGLGRIGKRVAEIAKVFGMKIQYFDPYLENSEIEKLPPDYQPLSLMEILRQSDVINLHVPLTKETRHLINHATIGHVENQPLLVNCSRGPVICEDDLCNALDKNIFSAVALDVFEKEPLPIDSRLINHPKVIYTPHIGGSTKEAFQKASMGAAEKIFAFFSQGAPGDSAPRISDELPPKAKWYQSQFR